MSKKLLKNNIKIYKMIKMIMQIMIVKIMKTKNLLILSNNNYIIT